MGGTRNHNRGHSICGIILTLISGALMGLASFTLKTFIDNVTMNLISLIVIPSVWIMIIFVLSGFYIYQKALKEVQMSIMIPLSTATGIAVPVVLSFLFLGEMISIIQWAGIIMIIAGTIGMMRKE